jgi:hypothetical protein
MKVPSGCQRPSGPVLRSRRRSRTFSASVRNWLVAATVSGVTLVEGTGIEPASIGVRDRCVTLTPTLRYVEGMGLEPTSFRVKAGGIAWMLTLLSAAATALAFEPHGPSPSWSPAESNGMLEASGLQPPWGCPPLIGLQKRRNPPRVFSGGSPVFLLQVVPP